MKFRVLGPVEAEQDGAQVRLGGPKQRGLLAFLLLHANRVVSRDQLIDGLWGEQAPASAGHTLEDYVSRLRKVLDTDRILTRSPGYSLRLEPDELDLVLFEQLVEMGEAALRSDRLREAVELFTEALALWRGPALGDVVYSPFASTEADRLEDMRISVLERRIEAELATGRSSALVGELELLVHEHPLRERLVELLMLALYRSGRQSSAFEAFRAARRRLVDELGVEPGPALQGLHVQILEHDPLLAPLVTPRREPSPSRPRSQSKWALAGLACGTLAIAAAMTGLLLSRGTRAAPADVTSSQLVALRSDSGKLIGRTQLAGAPAAAAAGEASVWLAEPDDEAVSRVDVETGDVVDRIDVPGGAGALTVGGGAVWAVPVQGSVVIRIDPATGRITQRIGLGGARASALAFGRGSLWIADTADSALIEIDPAEGAIRRVVQLEVRPTALALGTNSIWVADYDGNAVAEIDPRSRSTLATIRVGNGPGAIAVGPDAVWVANTLDSTLSRIDPDRGVVVATVPVGSGPAAVVVAGRSVWTADRYSGVSRLDSDRNVVVDETDVGGAPATLTAVGDELWVGLQPNTQRRGGTLRLLSTSPLSIDPAIQVNVPPPQTGGLTTDGLVAYNHVDGAAGLQLVPDLAIGLPTPSDGGRTYTFRLRPGIRYSDGRIVVASDFARAFARLFHFRPINSDSFRSVLGAASCTAARVTCDLSRGIVANDDARTVTFHLSEPDPNFLITLSYGSISAPVPPGTPLGSIGSHPIPGTGPYKVASVGKQEIRYVRNPYFREWSHAAQPDGNPDRIVMRFGLPRSQEVRAIIRGEADWMLDSVPTNLLPMLERQHASQLRSYARPGTDWLQVNTTLAPFDDVRVRRALNFAMDRRVAVRAFGGPRFGTVTCQILPRGVPGYRPYCPYTTNPGASRWTAPDFARARRLVVKSGTRGTHVTVWGWADDCCLTPSLVEYVAALLRRLGYPTSTRFITQDFFARSPTGVIDSIQLIPVGWGDPTADNFFSTWFTCLGAGDHGWFCDPQIDKEISQAKALLATDPRAAANRYASIDREIVDRAVAVPLFSERWIEFVSARVHNFQHNPNWGFLAAQASLR